jgi:phospholipid-binding lipoprotein MlaA
MGARTRDRGRLRLTGARAPIAVVALAATLLGACANVETEAPLAEKDRLTRFNDASFNGYQRVDRFLLKPAARGYDALPDAIQGRLSNFFENLMGPIDISNNLLQGKPKRGFSGIGRLIVNSTIGLGGLFDPASRMGMPRHAEDFGQTLAVWGIPSGPYLVLPIIGPTTPRDLAGIALGWQIHPATQYDDTSTRNSLIALDLIDRRADYLSGATEGALDREPDPYRAWRNYYDQRRRNDIFDGNPPDRFDFE